MRVWQLRLAPAEDNEADRLARQRNVSKNDVLRHALRLLLRFEEERKGGSRLLLERSGARRELAELWLVW